MKTPLLYLVYNRPGLTKQSLSAIRLAHPQSLYIAADGPKNGHDGQKCREVKQNIQEMIDWPCQLHTLYRQEHVGCRRGVSSAIDWFFNHVTAGIIIEDDCLPDPAFFRFAEELLQKYRNNDQILSISGSNPYALASNQKDSYYFTHYPEIWGWATWRRAWQQYDSNIKDWDKLRTTPWLDNLIGGIKAEYLHQMLDQVRSKKIDTWDYQFTYLHLKLSGLSVIPKYNLVTNIGFGKNATHTKTSQTPSTSRVPSNFFPLTHPSSVVINQKAEERLYQPIYRNLLTVLSLFVRRFARKYL